MPAAALLPGAGSSDLIFRALRHWLRRDSRVLLLDPTYGEYAHVLDKVIGCRTDRWDLPRSASYRWGPAELPGRVRAGDYDWVVLVNPNSPTGGSARSSVRTPRRFGRSASHNPRLDR